MKAYLRLNILLGCLLLSSCNSEFLEKRPQGQVTLSLLETRDGAEALLTGAYAILVGGSSDSDLGGFSANLTWGGLPADELHKGGPSSGNVELLQYETHQPIATGMIMLDKWRRCYTGIGRCNDAIKVLEKITDINETDRSRLIAEARFLRGHFHFDLKKIWDKIPFVDEKATDYRLSNKEDAWPHIQADFAYAIAHLPVKPALKGQISKGAAEAYLAKCYLFQNDFIQAKPLLETVIRDRGYSLAPYFWHNFNASFENNSETIFQIQMSVRDGANGANGIPSSVGGVSGGGTEAPNSLGYFQPSQDLVNAYQTVNGLPVPDRYFENTVKNDLGIPSSQPFSPYTGELDPRLDWTVGRRGIPFLGWGDFKGQAWINDQLHGGPYAPKKYTYTKSQNGQFAETPYSSNNAVNVNIIRLADVLLMAAECEVEIGSAEKAREYVNLVRERAMDSEGFVKRDDGTDAADYKIARYDSPWSDKEQARNAVRFERRLELALEGHRFFDLVRWGIAEQVINAYYGREVQMIPYLTGAVFRTDINKYMPIPWSEIVLSTVDGQPRLQQNPGY